MVGPLGSVAASTPNEDMIVAAARVASGTKRVERCISETAEAWTEGLGRSEDSFDGEVRGLDGRYAVGEEKRRGAGPNRFGKRPKSQGSRQEILVGLWQRALRCWMRAA